jgi:hypothetical protein
MSSIIHHFKGTRHVHNIFSNLFFQPPRYEEFSSNNFKILYCLNIPAYRSTTSVVVRSRHLLLNEKSTGFQSHRNQRSFFNKALYYVMLHFYLQQSGIIKTFLLCNIPGKVPLFFLYMRVNCMQNITKYYILLRNVASVLKLMINLKFLFDIVK